MKSLKTIALAMFAASLAACSNDDKGSTPKYITIDAQLSPATKTTVAADGTISFANGDAVSVYAWTGSATSLPTSANDFVVAGTANTYDGTKWTASPQMLWKDLSTPHFFLAVYPKRDILTEKSYTLDVNKQEESDLLVATNLGTNNNGIVATETAIPLAFDHLMSKLQVNLQFRNQWGEEGPQTVAVAINANSTADINFLTKTATPTGEASYIALPTVASTVAGYAKSYESVVIPQSDLKNIKVTVDGHDYVYTHDSNIQLQSGKTTIVNLMIGRNEITLDNLSIKGWETLVVIGDDNPIEVTD